MNELIRLKLNILSICFDRRALIFRYTYIYIFGDVDCRYSFETTNVILLHTIIYIWHKQILQIQTNKYFGLCLQCIRKHIYIYMPFDYCRTHKIYDISTCFASLINYHKYTIRTAYSDSLRCRIAFVRKAQCLVYLLYVWCDVIRRYTTPKVVWTIYVNISQYTI